MCQKGILKNIKSDQTSALVIHVPSTLSSSCFHQTISLGGSITLTELPDPFQLVVALPSPIPAYRPIDTLTSMHNTAT
jgi:hypothetical protein